MKRVSTLASHWAEVRQGIDNGVTKGARDQLQTFFYLGAYAGLKVIAEHEDSGAGFSELYNEASSFLHKTLG